MVIANTKFDEKGVELQKTARNLAQVEERFNGSCTRCTMFHRHADCNACPIREAVFDNIVKYHANLKDYPWVTKEFGSVT